MKKYISPNMEVVKTKMTNHLLTGSVTVSNTPTNDQWAREFEFEEEY